MVGLVEGEGWVMGGVVDGDSTMGRGVAIVRALSLAALILSGVPMMLIVLGMLAITGQQCTPTSVTHTLGDQLGIIAFAFLGFAVPATPAILLRVIGEPNLPKAMLSLVCAAGAVAYAVLALGLLAIGTTC